MRLTFETEPPLRLAFETEGPDSSSDLTDCLAILVDDIVSTGGTLIEAAQWLRDRGADSVWACVSHLVGRPSSLSHRLEDSPIERLIVTNSLPRLEPQAGAKIDFISLAPLLAQVVHQQRLKQLLRLRSLVPWVKSRGLCPRLAR